MVREIVRDPVRLAQPSVPATVMDLPVARDLQETLLHHAEHCAGMAANMIGVSRRIIAFFDGETLRVMLNPEIVSTRNPYETEEGCLSLAGQRKAKRWESITVQYEDMSFNKRTGTYSGFTAQIVQHEMDHLNGIII